METTERKNSGRGSATGMHDPREQVLHYLTKEFAGCTFPPLFDREMMKSCIAVIPEMTNQCVNGRKQICNIRTMLTRFQKLATAAISCTTGTLIGNVFDFSRIWGSPPWRLDWCVKKKGVFFFMERQVLFASAGKQSARCELPLVRKALE